MEEMTELEYAAEKEARRKTRKELSRLNEEIQDARTELQDSSSDLYNKLLQKKGELSKSVANASEQYMEASVTGGMVSALHVQAKNLFHHKLDFNSLVRETRKIFEDLDGNFSWTKLGRDSGALFKKVPRVSCMLGPINKEVKAPKRKVQKRCTDTTEETSRPEKVDQDHADEDDATNERVKNLLEVVHKESHQDGSSTARSFQLLDLLVDPVDSVQTVENFFDFSFLIKEKMVVQKVDSHSGLPVAKAVDPGTLDETEKNQMILSLSMKDLKQYLTEVYGNKYTQIETSQSSNTNSPAHSTSNTPISKTKAKLSETAKKAADSHPLHRDDPLYEAKNAHQQSEKLAEMAKLRKLRPLEQNMLSKESQQKRKREGNIALAIEGSEEESEEEEDLIVSSSNKKAKNNGNMVVDGKKRKGMSEVENLNQSSETGVKSTAGGKQGKGNKKTMEGKENAPLSTKK